MRKNYPTIPEASGTFPARCDMQGERTAIVSTHTAIAYLFTEGRGEEEVAAKDRFEYHNSSSISTEALPIFPF